MVGVITPDKKTFAAVFLKIFWLIIKIFSKTFPPCGRSLANFGTGRIDGWRYHSELTPHSTTILSPHITWIPHITPQYLSLHLATANTHTMLLCHPSIGKCKTRKVKISNKNHKQSCNMNYSLKMYERPIKRLSLFFKNCTFFFKMPERKFVFLVNVP